MNQIVVPLQGGSRWWLLADPICTVIFAIIVLFTTVGILRDISDILMERVPRALDADVIQADLQKVTHRLTMPAAALCLCQPAVEN